MLPYIAEFLGTMMLIILGDGVVANVNLNKSGMKGAGAVQITLAWGLAVLVPAFIFGEASGASFNPALTIALAVDGSFAWSMVPGYVIAQMAGAFVGASIVYLLFKGQFDATEDPGTKLGVFCTGPSIPNTGLNILSEAVGTFILVFAIKGIGNVTGLSTGVDKLFVFGIIVSVGMSLGGLTGYAINPARDLGPRLAHAVLPIKDKGDKLDEVDQLLNDVVAITSRGKPIKCKTVGQKKYVDLLKKKTITFGIGPAGTGKTYLAVAIAVNAYKSKQVEKIILTRPAVEAGEKLGFLPGDLQEKVNPYLRPLYDALQEMLGQETFAKMTERGTIEIAPLAYMRGRTLSNAYIILDEAQNTTREQIKMFLTRLGEGSKMIVTGDLTQVDLPKGTNSGLRHAVRILRDIDDIGIIKLSEKDVVRHPLVQQIVKAYEENGNAD